MAEADWVSTVPGHVREEAHAASGPLERAEAAFRRKERDKKMAV